MKSSIIYFFVIILLITSCDNANKTESNRNKSKNYTLEKKGEQSFSISPSSTNFTKYLQYYNKDNNQYLITANQNNYSIEVYSFSEEELIHKYKVPMEGKYNLRYPQIFGFYFFSFDSVFVNAYNRSQLLILNKNSEVIYNDTQDPASFGSMLTPLSRRPNVFFNRKIILGAHPTAPEGGEFWSYPLYKTYSLDDKEITAPKRNSFVEAKGNYGVFHSHHSFTVNPEDKLLVHNITYDPNLYVRDLISGKVVKKIKVPSKYFSTISPWSQNYNSEMEGDQEFYIENNSYKSIYYDRYRNVYYRFAERGVNIKDSKGDFNTWNDKLISIIVLNEDFEILNEIDLPQSKYRISDVFVGKNGLYVSKSNEKNPNYNEDLMNYDVFKLVEIN